MGDSFSSNQPEPDPRAFPATRWSLVARAGASADPAAWRAALDQLLRRYCPALSAHLVARGVGPHDAENLLQMFICDRVIERNLLAHAEQRRGRFRSFLLTSLDHFTANHRRAERAAKRTPGAGRLVPVGPENGVDVADPKAGDGGSGAPAPSDVAWARESLAEAVRRMRATCIADGRADLWDVFDSRVLAPAVGHSGPADYDELARRHGYASWKQAANALVTAKRKFGDALRLVLEDYCDDDADLEREMATLREVLASAAAREASAHDGAAGLSPGSATPPVGRADRPERNPPGRADGSPPAVN